MSPEQIQRQELTFHSDMYSLGVVLYELLTGQPPFTADNMEALVQKILQQAPVAPSKLRADLPKDLDRILLRALGKKPEQRYATWAEFALELSKLGEQGAAARHDPGQREIRRAEEGRDAVGRCPTRSCGSWRAPRSGRACPRSSVVMRENEPGQGASSCSARARSRSPARGGLLNMISEGECFGEMAYIRGGELPRHATVESMTDLLLAEFEPDAVGRMSLGAQLYLTRALVRNLVDRLELANTAARCSDCEPLSWD